MSPDSEMGDFPTSKSSTTEIRRILDSSTSSTRSTQNHCEKHDREEENGGHRGKRPRTSGEEVATPAVVGDGNGNAILSQSFSAPITTLGPTRMLQSGAINHGVESGHNDGSEYRKMYQTISPTQEEGLVSGLPTLPAVTQQAYTGELLQHAGSPIVAHDAPTPSLQQPSSTEGTQANPPVSVPPLTTTTSQQLIHQQSAALPANSTITFLPQHQQPQPTTMLNYAAFPPFQLQLAGVPSLPMAPPNVLNHQTTSPAHLLAIAAAASTGAAGIPQQAMNVYATHHQQAALLPSPQVQQPVPSPHHLVTLTGMGHAGGRRGALLYIPNDNEVLSESQIFLRKQIEFFETALEDVGKTTSGRRRPIMLNQVGIQCRHCGIIPTRYRQKAAVYYPAKLASIYQAAQNMALTHLTTQCQHIDEDTRKRLKEYQEGRSVAGHGGKKYWADTAKSQGVIECEGGGLRFAGTVPPVPQPATIMATLPTTSTVAATWQQAPPPSAA